MRPLYQYLMEATFSKQDFTKHKYLLDVIEKLLAGEPVRLGKNGEDGIATLADFDEMKLRALKNKFEAGQMPDVDEFNACSSKIKWGHIFKGDFSGYDKGLAEKNKGNAFEVAYCNMDNFNTIHRKDLEKITGPLGNVQLSLDGGKNSRRPLEISGNGVTVANSTRDGYNIGSLVTDITVSGGNLGDDKVYLSLKYGPKVTLGNPGVNNAECFPAVAFKKNGHFGRVGQNLLNMFGIDEQLFRDVFLSADDKNHIVTDDQIKDRLKAQGITNYSFSNKHGGIHVEVDPGNKADRRAIEELLKSFIGYGFILVHSIGGRVQYHDFRKAAAVNKLCKLKSVNIKYNFNGAAKRVDIDCDFSGILVSFNIRSKTGGTYPTHLMADYILK